MRKFTTALVLAAAMFVGQLSAQTVNDTEKQRQERLTKVYEALKSGQVNAPVADGYTPLQLAAMWATSPKVINELARAGADLNLQPTNGWSALNMAAMDNHNPEIIKAMVKAGAKINRRDPNGETPLSYAVFSDNVKAVEMLINLGAEVNFRDAADGKTLLMLSRSPEVFRMLISHGVNVNARDKNGMTALMVAAARENVSAGELEMIARAGADMNAVDRNGRTALMLAAGRTDKMAARTVYALRSLGARAEIKDNEGKTALDYAKANDTLIGSHVYMLLEEALNKN